MMNELIINAFVADALREAKKAGLKNKEYKPRKDGVQRITLPEWVDLFLRNLDSESGSKAINEV